jgi:hypothetical protein
MRPAKKLGKSVSSQSIKAKRLLASATPSTPLRNSPSVNTLKYRVDAGLVDIHATTLG